MKTSLSILGIVLLIIVGVFIYRADTRNGETSVCTQEAMICPDGSSVGRTGPNCEFAPCPGVPAALNPASGWTLATLPAAELQYHYPASLETTYVSLIDWPPTLRIVDEAFSCIEAGDVIASAGKTELKHLEGADFCVTSEGEGAAGSTYIQYAYAMPLASSTAILTFGTRMPQCMNYDEPERSACTNQQQSTNIDSLAARVLLTVEPMP
jgi:hypothetical protein